MTERDDEGRASGLGTIALVLACFWSIGVLYTPLVLYLGNAAEFTLLPGELLSYLVPLFLAAWIVTTSAGMMLPASLQRRAVALIAGLALLAWLQGHVLLWQLGPLDGRPIDWSRYWLQGLVDGALWLVALGVALRKSEPVHDAARWVALGLFAIQAVGLATSVSDYGGQSDAGAMRRFRIDDSTKFVLSSQRNVLVIIVDEFQSDVSLEVLEEDPELAARFGGFVYFRNAVAAASRTELAVPGMLTGHVYDNTIPRSEYLESAYLDHSIFRMLKDEGFHVEVHPWVGWGNASIFLDERIASNITQRSEQPAASKLLTEKKAKEVLNLLDLTLFRCLPLALKPYILNDYDWLLVEIATNLVPAGIRSSVANDHEFETSVFVEQFLDGLEVGELGDTFKYYHLKGAHLPLSVDPDELRLTDQTYPVTRRNYKAQVKESLMALARLFEALEQQGVYANSLIMVMGDHGSGNRNVILVNPSGEAVRSIADAPSPSVRTFQNDKAKAIATILVKPIGGSGPLRIARAPVSATDLPATIASELGIGPASSGVSMLALDPGAERKRSFSAFTWHSVKSSYVDDIRVYEIEGDSWLDSSWSFYALRRPMGAGPEEPTAQ